MAKIGIELWKKIERNQGYAYISDAVADGMSDEDVIVVVQNALIAAKRVVGILERFLQKYSNLTPHAADGLKARPSDEASRISIQARGYVVEAHRRR